MTTEFKSLGGLTAFTSAGEISVSADVIPIWDASAQTTKLATFAMAATKLTAASGVKNLRDYAGFDNTGATDCTANWEAAMAGGGTIEIPAGTYLLNNCDIPATADITLKPLGNVTIKWENANPAGMMFDNSANVSSATAVSAVADEDSYPTTFDQRTSRITGSAGTFSGWVAGDHGHIMSDDTSYDGFTKGEMFRVLYVHSDTSYIITTRHLFYTYDAGTYTTHVRRFTSKPKLRILPGITFTPGTDETASIANRYWGLILRGAIDAEVDVAFDGCYQACIRTQSCYGGRINLDAKNLYVNYTDGAYGYGVETRGADYGIEVNVTGDGTGHLMAPNGDMTTYATASWFRTGVPQDMYYRDTYSKNGKTAPVDVHWAIRPRFGRVVIENKAEESFTGVGAAFASIIGGIDPVFDFFSCRGVRGVISLRDCKGLNTRIRINHLDYTNTSPASMHPAIVVADTQTGSVKPEIHVHSGFVETPGQFPIANYGNGTDQGYKLVIGKGVTFGNCQGLVWYSGTRDMTVDLSGVWHSQSGASGGIVRYEVATASKLTIRDIDITRTGGAPTGLIRVAAAVAVTTTIGRVVCDDAAIPVNHPSSNGGATLTTNYLSGHGTPTSSAATGGSGSGGAGNQYIAMTINGTTYKVLHDGTL